MAQDPTRSRVIVPATRPLVSTSASGTQQTGNHVGGFVFPVDDLVRLTRLLCLGTESGSYHIGDEAMNIDNAQCVKRLIASGRGEEVVRMVLGYSEAGRTAKQNALMLVMAMCARQTVDPAAKKLCYDNLYRVCRIPTQLFMFIDYCEKVSGATEEHSHAATGWGRAHRRAICSWYQRFGETAETARELAMLVTKYKSWKGWSHYDVLRLAHPKPNPGDSGVAAIMKYIVKRFSATKEDLRNTGLLDFFQAVEEVNTQMDEVTVADRIRTHNLVREHVNTKLLKSVVVWQALLEKMPMTAMIRNLGKMTSLGMLDSGNERIITERLDNLDMLQKARIHPFSLLIALISYKTGKSKRGIKWIPNDAVLKALDSAFYLTFEMVPSTEKRYLLAVNISESMYNDNVNGCGNISPATAAAALSLVTARTQRQCEIIAFTDDVVPVTIAADMKLTDVETAIKSARPRTGLVDCSIPMQYAIKYKKEFDTIIVYTSNDNNAGYIHAMEQLNVYRTTSGIHVKLIVCAMSSAGFSIGDCDDAAVLLVPGFDTDAPTVMNDFVMQ